ncbi:hypothetical protein Cgig2_016621 [Carnegiea gigantea]|uniref:Transcription repressor n=1 Tax=Carnegiea gigantea TaxID=171969 RepID=A0A9Q1QTT2_9CARY|nr:hypothetical protein Cgig2_016621 [Carnegiea gigantea]
MPKNLQKSVQDYLSKIKKQTPHLQFSPSSLSSTTSKIFSGCKHPKSLSFSVDHKGAKEGEEVAATLEDIDRFLIENFKSLYGHQDHDQRDNDDHGLKYEEGADKAHGCSHHGPKGRGSTLEQGAPFDSPRFFTPPPDLCGSHRFFISPSPSGSVLETQASMAGSPNPEDAGSSAEDPGGHHEHDTKIPGGMEDCLAVLTVSQSPYEDYRKSMQQVLEARVHHKQRVDWDFMEELLFCYLRLNEKKQYRFRHFNCDEKHNYSLAESTIASTLQVSSNCTEPKKLKFSVRKH